MITSFSASRLKKKTSELNHLSEVLTKIMVVPDETLVEGEA